MAQDRHEPLRATDQDQAEAGSLALAIGDGVRRVVVPDDVGLLTAEFSRRGPDLAIGNPDAPALVVLDYFVADAPPDLATGGGAVLPGRIVETLAGRDVAPGAGPDAASAEAEAPIGHVEQLDGEVVILRADGGRTVASEGTPVFQDDVVTTDAGGAVGLRFVDGMTLSLGSDARMVLDEFAYDPATHQGGGVIDVIQGAFSFVSGQAAHVGLDSLVIDTPTMTIGIRGTKVVAQAAAEGETTTVVLLPEDDGTIGKIMIGTEAGQELLEQPFVSTTVTSRFLPPAPQTFVAPEWVYAKFAKPLSFLPPEQHQADGPAQNPYERGDISPLNDDLQEAEAAALDEQTAPRDWSAEPPEVGSPGRTTEAAHPGGDVALSLPVSKEDEAPDRAESESSPQDPDLPPMLTVEGQAKVDVSEARDPSPEVIFDSNDAPVVVAPIGDTGSAEDGAFVYDVAGSFSDPEGQSLTFGAEQSGGTPLPPWLAIDPATGMLSGTPANGDVGRLSIDVTATDGAGATATASFQLTVTNANDTPVVVTPIADTAPAEDAVFSYDVAASFADADVGDTLTFSAEQNGGAPLPAWLAIDPATGVLSGTPANGDVGRLTLDVTATDGAGASATSSFRLTVTNTNDAPVVVTPIADTATAEDAAFSFDVAARFADADVGDTLSYSAEQSGGAPLPAWLAIDPATGVLSGTPANGDVGGLTVDVTATDGSGATATAGFQLTVTNTNDAPVVVTPIADTATAEDAAFSYDVSASFTDLDAGDSLTYSAELSGGAPLPAWLVIDPATGVLSGTPVNADVGGLTVDVTATDGSGATATAGFQLTVTNTNDAPVVVTPIADTATAEDAAFSYDVSASFADVDAGDSLTYSAELSGGAPLPAWLVIDPATGVLSGTPVNADVGGLTVDVTATDGSGATATAGFQLTVTNTNDTPVVVTPIADTAPAEDAVFSYDVAASFADVDAGDSLTYSAELSGGAPLPAWLVIDPATGVLSGTPANGDVGGLTVDVTATDGSGATATAGFQLTVTNTNDAPVVVTPIADTATAEDAAFSYDVSASFADVDAGDSLTYSAELSGGAPLPAWLVIDPATGVLSGTPVNADVGGLTVDVTATDGSGATATAGFQLTVTNTNDAPVVVTPIADTATAEDAAFSYDVSASFADVDAGDSLTYSAELSGGAPLPAWLVIDPATGVLSGTPVNADVGGLTVDVTATDGSGATATAGFQLTVTNTNDAPVVVTPIADTVTAEDAAFSYDVSASFADVDAGDSLTYSAELSGGAPLPAWLVIDPATGVLSGTPVNADVGGLTVDVTATDGSGATATAGFQLTVTNTNDTPVVVTPIADTAPAEDAVFSYDVAASFADVDAGDSLTYSAELSGGAPLPAWLVIDPATGVLSGTPANGDVGGLTVDVTATDGSGATATAGFQLTVTNTNDAPVVVTPIADTATAEDAAFSYDVSASFADVDAGDSLTYSAELSGGAPLPAWLSIDAATGVLLGTPANGDVGALTVDVTATDGSGATATAGFQLTVTNTNDAPVVVIPIPDAAPTQDVAFAYDASLHFGDDDVIHGDTLTYDAQQPGGAPLPAWLSIDPGTGVLSGTPGAGDVGASFVVEVTATDAIGSSATTSFQVTVDNVNDAPVVVTPIADTATAEDAAFSYDVSGSFNDLDAGEPLTYSAELSGGAPLPAWLVIDPATGVLSGTPANGDVGGLTVDVTATDGSGATATSSFQLTVTNTNDAPVVVTPIADTATAEDAAFSYDVSASFADVDAGDSLTYSAELSGGAPLPAWLVIDPATGVLSGTPVNADVGGLTVDVTATDGSGATATAGFQLTVTNTNDAPVVVTPIADTATAEDAAFSYDVSASFADVDAGDSLTYSAELSGGAPLPAWLVIDPATGVLSGTPVNADVGGLTVDVTATDGSGATATAGFQLTVTNTNDAPVVVTPIADTATAEDAAFSYDVSASFADVDAGDSLTYSAELSGGAPLPAWLVIDPATGVLSGTPVNADVGGLTVDVTATDGSGATAISSFQLTITNTNDAPVLDDAASPVLVTIQKNATDPEGDTVGDIVVDGSITDVDGPSVEAIAVIGVDDTNGNWEYSTDGGANWSTVGAVSDSSALLLDASGKLRFVPNTGFEGNATFTFRAWDQTVGTAGETVDASANGGTTAYSATSDSASVTVVDGELDFGSGSEFQVNSFTASNQENPSIAALDAGGYVVVWQSNNQDGQQTGVFGQRFDDDGAPVGGEFQINTHTTKEQESPSVAALADGGFVVAWQSKDQDGSNWGIYGQRFDAASNAVGTEFKINTFTANEQESPSVAALADGGFVVAWQSKDQDGDNWGVYGQRYDATGATVGGEFPVNSETIKEQQSPSVAALADGGFVVVWQSMDQDGHDWGAYGQRFDGVGNAIGTEFRISTETSAEQEAPSVAALADGGFVAVWQSRAQDGDGWGIYGQRYDAAGNAAEFEFQVNEFTTDNQADPTVVGLGDGGFLVSWESENQDGGANGVFARRYTADGDAVGGEFQLNTENIADQQDPALALLADGDLVAAWESNNQDGHQLGVFGHHYENETASVTVNPPAAAATSLLDFGSSNSYVDVGDPGIQSYDLDMQSRDLTVEAWFYYDGPAAGQQTIVSKYNDVVTSEGYSIFLDNGELVVRVNSTGGPADGDTGASSITMPGEVGWYHVAMVIDQEAGAGAGTVTGYLNGSSAGWSAGHGSVANDTFTAETGGTHNNESLLIGAVDDGGIASNFFDGEIADVRVWNTVRSQAEIQADLGRTLNGDEDHLIGNWRLDDGAGGTAVDSGPGGYDGVLGGGPAWESGTDFTTPMDTDIAGRISATDPEGDLLSYGIAAGPANGTAVIDPQSGTWSYTPDPGYAGGDSVSYQVSDGNGGSDVVNIAITVTP